MAELMHCDSSKLFDSHHSGCIWGLFRLFDVYQQRGSMKKLLYRRHGNGKHGGGTKMLMANEEVGETYDIALERSSLLMENKSKVNRNSPKARILNLFNKRLQNKKRKGKISPSSPLIRTISIHHLECNDHVLPGELDQMASDSEASNMEYDESNSSTIGDQGSKVSIDPLKSFNGRQGACETIDSASESSYKTQKLVKLRNRLLDEHMILKEKLDVARDTLLRQKDADPLGMNKDFSLQSTVLLDTLNLFNANKEALLNIHKDPNYLLSESLQVSEGPSRSPMPRHKQMVVDSLISQERNTMFDSLLIDNAGNSSDSKVLPSCNKLRKQRGDRTVMNRLRNLKQKIKDVIEDNGKEHHRISKDRILHKVPIGQKIQEVSEDVKFECVEPGLSNRKFAYMSIRRSCSLTESLGRYSQLLESISVNEYRKVPRRSKSIREDGIQQQENLPKILGRIMSNPGFRSYSSGMNGQTELISLRQLWKKPTLDASDSDMAASSDRFDKLEVYPVKATLVEEISGEGAEAAEYHTTKNEEIGEGSYKLTTTTIGKSVLETVGQQGHTVPEKELNQSYPFEVLDALEEESALLKEYHTRIQDEQNVKPEKPSPISVLNSNFVGEPVSPVNYLVPEDSELKPFCISLEDQHPPYEGQNHTENIADSFLVHVDQEHVALYNYVRDILSKSGYGLLLEETTFLPDEIDSRSILSGMTSEEQQLFHHLIKEVLLQIYENSESSGPRLSRMNARIRPMPVGNYLLEELWTEIRWHICSSQGLGTGLNDLIARDFAKNDGWMNLYLDAECFGLLLEDLILDDLLDEIILDSH